MAASSIETNKQSLQASRDIETHTIKHCKDKPVVAVPLGICGLFVIKEYKQYGWSQLLSSNNR